VKLLRCSSFCAARAALADRHTRNTRVRVAELVFELQRAMFASNVPKLIEGKLAKKSDWMGSWRSRDVAVQAPSRATPGVISWQGGGRVGAIILADGCSRIEGGILFVSCPERTVQFRTEAGAAVPIEAWHQAIVSASPAAAGSARSSMKSAASSARDAAASEAAAGVAAMSLSPANGAAPERPVRAVLRPAEGGTGVVQFKLNFGAR